MDDQIAGAQTIKSKSIADDLVVKMPMGNHPLCILKRFPAERHALTLKIAQDPEFYAICQDYDICFKALCYWTASNEPVADARCAEYRTLMRALEKEIVEWLNCSDSQ